MEAEKEVKENEKLPDPVVLIDDAEEKKAAVADEDEVAALVVCKGAIRLNKRVNCCNFCTFLYVACTTIMLLVFLNAMQAYLLKDVFEVDTDDLGTVTANLGLVDEIWSLITLAGWGIVSDNLGRRWVVVLGYLHIGVGCFIIPTVGKVYPGLLLGRLVYAQGASALSSMLTALLADYVQKEDIGKGAGLLGLMAGFGAIIAAFVLVSSIPLTFCIVQTYYIVGLIGFISACLAFYGLQKASEQRASGDYQAPESNNVFVLLKQGLAVAYQNRHVALGYLGGFLARGDSVVSSTFISLWITRFYSDSGACFVEGENITDVSTCGENLVNEDQAECPEAYTLYRTLSGTASAISLIFALIFGYLGDKYKPVNQLLGSAILGVVGFGLVFGLDSPEDSLTNVAVIMWSVAQIAIVITAQTLLVKNIPQDIKGTVAGCYSMIGSIGVMFFTYVGGLLFDEWSATAPFVLAFFFSIIVVVASLYVRKKDAADASA